jgi:RsiW-degrading membrane proteinase PrsW (M82 family)
MSAATPTPPTAAQVAAIDASGLGHTFHIFQPRNLASWVFLWYLFVGAIAAFRWFRPQYVAVGSATIAGFALFALYALPWLRFLRRKDFWTPIPARLLAFGFLWGGLTATFFIAITANDALLSIYNKTVSATFAQDWGPGLAAPFTEETGKGIGILLLMFIAPRLIRTPFDGFIVGAFVGLGFQIFEDVLYAINQSVQGFGGNQFGSVIQIVLMRGLAGFFSHALFSAIYGTALVHLVGTSTTRRRVPLGIGMILLAMVVHGVWDAASALAGAAGLNPFVLMLILGLIELVIIIAIGRRVAGGERSWMHELLAPEVTRGTLTAAELAAVSGSRKDRRHFVKTAKGYRDSKTPGHVLDAAGDLAEAIATSGGQPTKDVAFARAEVVRVRGTTFHSVTA